jgi:hypothetical protein
MVKTTFALSSWSWWFNPNPLLLNMVIDKNSHQAFRSLVCR